MQASTKRVIHCPAALLAIICLLFGFVRLGAAPVSLQEIAVGIRSSRSAMRSMEARYTVRYRDKEWDRTANEGGQRVQRDCAAGDYVWAVEDIAATKDTRRFMRQPLVGGGQLVLSFDGKVSTELTVFGDGTPPRAKVTSGVDLSQWYRFGQLDMLSLLYWVDMDTWEHAFGTGSLRITGTDAVDGRTTCILEGRVSVFPDRGEQGKNGIPVKAWVDPERGYSIARLEVFGQDGTVEPFHSYDVLWLKRIAEGLWVPVHVLYRHGKEVLITEITVNGEIAADLYTIELPDGTQVQNAVTGKHDVIIGGPTALP